MIVTLFLTLLYIQSAEDIYFTSLIGKSAFIQNVNSSSLIISDITDNTMIINPFFFQ